MAKEKIILNMIMVLLFLIPFVYSSMTLGGNINKAVQLSSPQQTTNFSSLNVNNSDFLDGFDWTTFPNRIFWYNQTAPALTNIYTFIASNNAYWNWTYNSSYDAGIPFFYNQTTPAINFCTNNFLNSNQLNQTYRKLNDLINVANISDAINISNKSLISCSNITGGTDSDFCTDSGGGNPFNQNLNTSSNVTFANIRGEGLANFTNNIYIKNNTKVAGVPFINETIVPLRVLNSTLFNLSVLSMPILASRNYSFECIINFNASATTTGGQFNITVPNSPTWLSVSYINPTSTTATLYNACSQNTVNCLSLGTASAGATLIPLQVTGRLINGANQGIIGLYVRTEVGASSVTIPRGAWCKLWEEYSNG
jgi:hypothetical protein